MKIFLEAFIDNNFGDNLFVHIITNRYREHTFYMIPKPEYRESYDVLKANVENLRLVEDEDTDTFLEGMDAMFLVGGDMFGNGGDYSTLIRQASIIKRKGGVVAFLGLSLFREYGRRTKFDLMRIFSKADIIVVRESTTYQQLKRLVPWAKVVCAADMVFTLDTANIKRQPFHPNLLGISIRKKGHLNETFHYERYCQKIAKIATEYLAQNEENKVHFLAFSSGRYDDRKVAEDIMALCPEINRSRMRCVSFAGNVNEYMKEIQQCAYLICTRFHALVFALILNKPFLPIVYEEKMERLLDEIGYAGVRLYYENLIIEDGILGMWKQGQYSDEKMNQYLKKGKVFFDKLDEWMN